MMQRCKADLSVLLVPLLAGAAAATTVHAEPPVGRLVPPQTSAQTRAPTSSDQTDPLRQPVTLDLVDAPLGSALEAITRHAGLTLAYDANVLPRGKIVTLHATELPARDALARVLDGTGLEPTMMRSGHVTVARPPELPLRGLEAATVRPQQAVVTGTVTDAGTAEPLRGAEVRVDESSVTTVTDAEGRYTLEDVPAGTHTFIASMIGYGEARQDATVAAGTTASVDFALTVSALPLDEMVVTGTMVPTQLRAVPSPVSVITAEDIERKGIVRFEDILRSVPGVGVASNGGQDHLTYVYVRGASTTTGTNMIKTYIDGVEVANPFYSLNQIDPASVERIELIRGPQASTLYGSEAIAGVLQIFTKKGHIGAQRHRIQATIAGGMLESPYESGFTPVQNHSAVIAGGEQNLSYNLGATYRYTGEWVEDELIDELGWDVDNSVITDLALSGGLRYVNGPITVEAAARTFNKSRGGPLEREVTELARNGSLNYAYYTKPSGIESDVDIQTFGLTFRYAATPRWQHSLTLGYDATAIEIRQPQPRLTTPADTLLMYQSADWSRQSASYRTAIDMALSDNLSSTIQAGVDRSTFDQRVVIVQDAVQLVGGLGNERANITRGVLTNYGYYAQSQVSWRDELFLTAGLRADQSSGFGADQGHAWSPRVGLAYALEIGALTLKSRAAFGTAIRPPEPQQRLGETRGNFVTLENRSLEPETQTGYDFGVEVYAGNHLAIGVTRYDQTADDLVAPVRMSEPGGIPQITQFQNVGRIKNAGWEIDGSVRLDPVTVTGHYTLMESTVEQLSPTYTGADFVVGARPLDTPRSTGAFSIAYRNPRATVTLGGSYKGSWQQYRWIRYLNALLGSDPEREPYSGDLRDYVDDYPAVWRYQMNATLAIARRVEGVIMIDNLLNDRRPDQRDINLVRGRQIMVGIRFDSGE